MPAASEINACCPTSLTLLKRPEDSADGFNGLLLFVLVTIQNCHVNTNFSNLNIPQLQLSKQSIWQKLRRTARTLIMKGDCAWLTGDLLFLVLMSRGSVSRVHGRKCTLV